MISTFQETLTLTQNMKETKGTDPMLTRVPPSVRLQDRKSRDVPSFDQTLQHFEKPFNEQGTP